MKTVFIISILWLLLASCCLNSDCTISNPVLNTNPPNSPAYNAELVRLLKINKHELCYHIDGTAIVGIDTFLIAKVHGGNLCAKLWMNINEGNTEREKSFRMMARTNKMYGYHGAGLGGLKYRIENKGNGYRFVYEGVDKIID